MQTEQVLDSGNFNVLKPRKALNKAFLKVKPNRSQIEQFKVNLIQLLDRSNETESEEFHKNLVTDFLKKTWYDPHHFINTKGRTDLVIHNGNKAKTSVGVIIEAKKPTNKAEMLTRDKINVKAFQELVLYYLRERITHKNLEVKYVVATNINEWFIFDANFFEKAFAQNKKLVNQFTDFEAGRLAGKTTDFFYKNIAEPFIAQLQQEVEFTHFDIRNYEKPLRNNNPKDDNKLIALFKLLSPEHLLKLPFLNDSNSLDKRFYGELLHIIGLTENKQGGKKVIERQKEGQRNTGSFLENAIIQLDSMDKIGRLDNPTHFGATHEERLFSVGLQLSITWLNRILFLKLLEAQLLTYHKGDKSYEFLSLDRIHNYDDLNSLFFQVLARRHSERNEDVKALFEKVPYLNSSLFEPTDIEHATLFISNLRDDQTLPIYSATVLKDKKGKKRSGELNALEYLFEFLNAYDFSSEGGETIQEDNKTLINASVLGLIFEKINGYKDGSFFTPGFITMYMCRETIRKAVVQKFNETKGWNCKDLEELYDRIEDRKEANEVINSLKICDPAVGSGHFLVSALNEIIAIKNDLNILQDRHGRRLKEYHVEVVNDELIVTDDDGELFEYNPSGKESQRVQEALFHEKQKIIENCLFGVDINPNSVKICRLRLWIELLKNAYYKNDVSSGNGAGSVSSSGPAGLYREQGAVPALETLPNIDINIKCGNSLISRFDLDADLSKALKESKWNIDSYRVAVDTYRNAHNKEQKREMEKIIHDIKNDFRSEISTNDPKVKRLERLKGEIFLMANQTQLFEQSKKEKAAWNKKLENLTKDSKKLETEIREIKDNKIYEDAFEWRFEFPEVLDDNGDYVGFDVVIGNPPYVNFANLSESNRNFYNKFELYKNKTDLYAFFIGLADAVKNDTGLICFIIPHTWVSTTSFFPLRKFLLEKVVLNTIVELDFGVFKDAYVKTVIIQTGNANQSNIKLLDDSFSLKAEIPKEVILKDKELKINLTWNPRNFAIYSKIKKDAIKLGDIIHFSRGIKTSNDKKFLFKEDKGEDFYKIIRGRNIKAFRIDYDDEYIWYRPDLMKEKTGSLPHTKEVFLAPEKIITQRVNSSGQLLATFDDEQFFCLDTTNVSSKILDEKIDLKFLVGLLNSKLINWWFNDEFKNPTISGYELHQIPVKLSDKSEKEISALVSNILDRRKNGENVTIELLHIDRLVYELYGLTEEEIGIVEGN
ncbi:MAG: TaqI-like C-terminal specificity domain-containing protein [Christiangramia sp.]|nr:TaqI-like C-terminal specificity domain-containing protein [Christiangramia sp.]